MEPWTCPECNRLLMRRNQSHECAPAMSLDEYFSTGPERERPIFEAVMARLDPVGPVHVEPVSVGILLKRLRTFAELRPKRDWQALSFALPYELRHGRMARKVVHSGSRWFHVVNLRDAAEVDDQVGEWLTESYLADV